MKILVSLFLLLSTVAAHADTPNTTFEYVLNHIQGLPQFLKWSVGSKIREAHSQAVCVYDYATLGGSTAANITLKNTDLKTNCSVPAGSIILNGFVDPTTTLTSGGAATRITLNTGNSSANLLASVAITSGTRVALIPVWGTLSTAVKVTAATNITMRAVSGTIGAGHFRVFLNYAVGE